MNPQRNNVPINPQPTQQPVAPAKSFKAEIVSDIPVKNPITRSDAPVSRSENPISQAAKHIMESGKGEGDKELDGILHEVNSAIKKGENPAHHQQKPLKDLSQKTHSQSGPIVATAIACVVALVLTVSAILIFKNS